MPRRVTKLGDKCKDCDEELTPENVKRAGFHIAKRCRTCSIKRDIENAKHNNTFKKYRLKVRYGMTLEEFNKRFEKQLGGCAICKRQLDKPYVDHDHRTGMNRDLLCLRCNAILGMADDDELLLFDIIEYLKRHSLKKAI